MENKEFTEFRGAYISPAALKEYNWDIVAVKIYIRELCEYNWLTFNRRFNGSVTRIKGRLGLYDMPIDVFKQAIRELELEKKIIVEANNYEGKVFYELMPTIVFSEDDGVRL